MNGLVRRPRILHVCEAWDGGVAAAVHGIARYLHCADHTVLVVRRRWLLADIEEQPGVTYIVPDGPVSALRAMRYIATCYRDLAPDIVHAHSSYAGVYVRCSPRIPRSKIVYSPHCLAFERQDIGRLQRSLFRSIERAAARRTDTFAACNDREAELGRGLFKGMRVVTLSHVPNIPAKMISLARSPENGTPLRVVGVGRLCQQKDPAYFAETVRHATLRGLKADWTWIGGGSQDRHDELAEVGVRVMGWQPRNVVLETMSKSHALLHSAVWEANALCILEAAAIGLPVVARDLPSMQGAPVSSWVSGPRDAAIALEGLANPAKWAQQQQMTYAVVSPLLDEHKVLAAISEAYQLGVTRRRDGLPKPGFDQRHSELR